MLYSRVYSRHGTNQNFNTISSDGKFHPADIFCKGSNLPPLCKTSNRNDTLARISTFWSWLPHAPDIISWRNGHIRSRMIIGAQTSLPLTLQLILFQGYLRAIGLITRKTMSSLRLTKNIKYTVCQHRHMFAAYPNLLCGYLDSSKPRDLETSLHFKDVAIFEKCAREAPPSEAGLDQPRGHSCQ